MPTAHPAPQKPAPSPAGSAPLWTIDNQEIEMVYPNQAEPYAQWRIYFTTRSGFSSWINIPEAQYNGQKVVDDLNAYAAQIENIGALKGPES